MTLNVIGTGLGRTGTYSLKLAINHLGLGPCHHMEEVLHNMPVQLPLWSRALAGQPDWQKIYAGYASAVDWPNVGFFRELYQAYPKAKFILTHRSPESWVDSFTKTIYRMLEIRDKMPPEMKTALNITAGIVAKTGFPAGLDREQLAEAFVAHTEAVKNTIPPKQLLVYEVKEGWEPLCNFLGVPVPADPFPRSNDREEFWDRFSL